LGFIGYLFNYVAPGAVGGDLIKASLIAREQTERRLVAVATVFLDRVVGLVGLLLLGAVMMLFPTPILQNSNFRYIIGVFQIGAVVSLAGMAIVLLPGVSRLPLLRRVVALPKIGPLFAELINSIRLYQSRWRVLVLGLVMSLISHAGLILSIYFCALALHGGDRIPSLLGHLQILPPAELAGVLVPLPGGIGALEGAVGYFYKLADSNPDHGFLTAIAYRLMTIVIAVVGAIWYLFNRREIDEVLHELEPAEEAEEPGGNPPADAFEEVKQTAVDASDCPA
jgi:glycosyltransferase 2 family protein